MSTLWLKDEPTERTYRDLLAFAVQQSTALSLVWRLGFGSHGLAVEKALRSWQTREQKTQEWPGTTLLSRSDFALVRFYKPHRRIVEELGKAPGLYSWIAANDRPEDLAFYGSDGACWLGSIAHEREAFIDTNAIDVNALVEAVPRIELVRG